MAAIEEKVAPKSFFYSHRWAKNAALAFSWLFNIASALGATYLAFWLAEWLGAGRVLAIGIGIAALAMLEYVKRKSASEFFQVYFFRKSVSPGWLGVSLVIAAVSIASTYKGAHQGALDFSPPPPVVGNDTTLNRLYAQLSILDDHIEASKKTTWRGKITRKSQKAIANYSEEKARVMSLIAEKEQAKDAKNKTIEIDHEAQRQETAQLTALATLVMELCFWFCVGFVQLYWYRSYVEYKAGASGQGSPTPSGGGSSKPEDSGAPTPSGGGGRKRPERKPEAPAGSHLQVVASDEEDEPGESTNAELEAFLFALKHAKKLWQAEQNNAKMASSKASKEKALARAEGWAGKMQYYHTRIRDLQQVGVA